MPRPLLVANWKMHKTQGESREFVDEFARAGGGGACDIVICPAFTALATVGSALKGTGMALGAQDVHWESKGAFTGEVSVAMLRDCLCSYVIVGHSERRTLFGETDRTVNLKVRAALAGTLIPIVCVGETLDQRRAGKTHGIVLAQLEAALDGVTPGRDLPLVIAYEPVWAIGSGVAATASDAGDVASFIRRKLEGWGTRATACRVLYGGSVKPENIGEFMVQPGIDGALVGGASLDPQVFAALAKAAGRRE
ncbi:MAG: triose-phosphate isomerase [Bacillota bacterium]